MTARGTLIKLALTVHVSVRTLPLMTIEAGIRVVTTGASVYNSD